jgi:hypothetical protein
LRARRRRQAGFGLLIGAAACLWAASCAVLPALAGSAWAIVATGSGVAQASVVPMGKPPTVTVLQGSVRLEWAPSTYGSGDEVGQYLVKRQTVGSAEALEVCTVAAPSRACHDDKPPSDQQVVYTVVPAEQLWRGAASPPSAPVTVSPPPAALTPAPTAAGPASPDPSPSPSASSTPTPEATAPPGESPSPTPDLLPSPTPT